MKRLLSALVLVAALSACSSFRQSNEASPPAAAPASSPTSAATAVFSSSVIRPPSSVTPAAPATPAAAAIPPSGQAIPVTARAEPLRSFDPAELERSGDLALEHLRVLTVDIGVRLSGTDGERRAAEYLAAQFRSYGYQVELQPFPVTIFEARRTELTLGDGEAVKASPLGQSRAGEASGRIVPAGLGRTTDLPAAGLTGQVALVRRGEITFGEKARNVAQAGAVAMIVYEPGRGTVGGTLTGDIPAIPVISIEGARGETLAQQAATGNVSARVLFDGGLNEITATNVIARPAGGSCKVVAGGHYDTVGNTTGASDNASGTAVTVELARIQALRGNPEGACFIAFSGEEEGLIGSRYYVEHLTLEQRQAIRFMINLDMNAIGTPWWVVGWRDLLGPAIEVAAKHGVTATRGQLAGADSDHSSFIACKIPAVFLHKPDDRLIHSPEDRFERITAEPLGQSVRISLGLITDLQPEADTGDRSTCGR